MNREPVAEKSTGRYPLLWSVQKVSEGLLSLGDILLTFDRKRWYAVQARTCSFRESRLANEDSDGQIHISIGPECA